VKYRISIRAFVAILIAIFLFVGFVAIYKFYNDEKTTIGKLASIELKNRILTLSFMVKKNLQRNRDINFIKSRLDNVVITNDIIKNLYIMDSNDNIIYSSDRKKHVILPEMCADIRNFDGNLLFSKKACIHKISLYRGDKKYDYKIYFVIDHQYLNSLLKASFYNSLQYFLVLIVVLLVLLWIFINKVIVSPLEELRQYAYYNMHSPSEFFIKEFESIRYSLSMTFNRLKKEQRDLYKLSTKDTLTGLYNRLSLYDKIAELISKNKRETKHFSVLFIDLDNFKDINDLMGHDTGDEILKHIAKIILKSVRENDFVARIGGDEFVVLLSDFENNLQIVEVAQRILDKISKPIINNMETFYLSASIGIVLYPKNGNTATELIKNADIAMYKAKKLGKNQFYFFTKKLNNALQEKVAIQNRLKNALKNDHFKLYYQPKVDIKSGKIVSCEALIRWIDPEIGIISPDKFIPLSEENGFIIPLGEWILKEGVNQVKAWKNTKLKEIKVSVNVSAYQFNDVNFYDKVKNVTSSIDRDRFDLEITESVFLKKSTKNIETIKKLKDLGLSISLDDFGTGYSSLSYLRQIPINTIKIDKSFIDAYHEENGKSFIRLIVELGKTLGLNTVAEGVETKEQYEFLKNIGCDRYQGYLCSRPLPAEEFEEFLIKFNKL